MDCLKWIRFRHLVAIFVSLLTYLSILNYLIRTEFNLRPLRTLFHSHNQQKLLLWEQFLSGVRTTPDRKRMPDAVIVGAEKCGTTALVWFLRQHPLVKTPQRPEQAYFNRLNYEKRTYKYMRELPAAKDHEIVMEKTPAYFKSEQALEAIRKKIPNAKIIVIICDPVNRTYSDFLQHKAIGSIRKRSNFDEYVGHLIANYGERFLNQSDDVLSETLFKHQYAKGYPHLVTTGLYYYYVKRWLKYYTLNKNFFIVDGEEFLYKPWISIDQIQDFLNIPKLITQEDFRKKSSGFFCLRKWSTNETSSEDYQCMDDSHKGRSRLQAGNWDPKPLMEYFHGANEKLFKLIGKRFNWL